VNTLDALDLVQAKHRNGSTRQAGRADLWSIVQRSVDSHRARQRGRMDRPDVIKWDPKFTRRVKELVAPLLNAWCRPEVLAEVAI
jgi:hypothetical protein